MLIVLQLLFYLHDFSSKQLVIQNFGNGLFRVYIQIGKPKNNIMFFPSQMRTSQPNRLSTNSFVKKATASLETPIQVLSVDGIKIQFSLQGSSLQVSISEGLLARKIMNYDIPAPLKQISSRDILQRYVKTFRWEIIRFNSGDFSIRSIGALKGGMQEMDYPEQTLNFKKIDQLLAKKNLIVQTSNGITFLIGTTQCGKSTLINKLLGNQMKVITSGEKLQYQVVSGNGPKIGNEYISETDTISLFKDNKNGLTYCDTPGFFQTKGPEEDIANGVLIKEGFKRNKKIKILLVFEESQFGSRASVFINSIGQLYDMIPNFKDIKDSTAIILTKTEKSLESIRQQMVKISQNRGRYFQDPKKTRYLMSITSLPLFLFPHINILEGKQCKAEEEIILGIQKLQFATDLKIQRIPIAPETQNIIMVTMTKYREQLITQMNQTIPEAIRKMCKFSEEKQILYPILRTSKKIIYTMRLIYNKYTNGEIELYDSILSLIRSLTQNFKINTTIVGIIEVLRYRHEMDLSFGNKRQVELLPLDKIDIQINSQIEKITEEVLKNLKILFQDKWDKIWGKLSNAKPDILKQQMQEIDTLLRLSDTKFFAKGVSMNIFEGQDEEVTGIIQICVKEIEEAAKQSNEDQMGQPNQQYLISNKYLKIETKALQVKLISFLRTYFMERREIISLKWMQSPQNNKKEVDEQVLQRKQKLDEVIYGKGEISQYRNSIVIERHHVQLTMYNGNIKDHIKRVQHLPSFNMKKDTSEPSQQSFLQALKALAEGNQNALKDLFQQRNISSSPLLNQELVTIGYFIYIYAGSEVVIDDHFNGHGNLIIVAPTITIKKTKYNQNPKLTLRGLDGESLLNDKQKKKIAKGKTDFDEDSSSHALTGDLGCNGNDGYPGGNVVFITNNLKNQSELIIDVSGGNASKGQDGGDGADCITDDYWFGPKIGNGGNGGNGGDGGCGGVPGYFELYNINGIVNDHDVTVVNNAGQCGQPGKPGQGGTPYSKFETTQKGQNGSLGKSSTTPWLYASEVFGQLSFDHVRRQYHNYMVKKYSGTGYENFLNPQNPNEAMYR